MTLTTISALVMKGALVLGWFGFAAAIWCRPRRRSAPTSTVARAPRSLMGIAAQGVAFALVWSAQRPDSLPILAHPSVLDPLAALVVIGVFGGSVILVLRSIRELGRQWGLEARLVDQHALITTGPYATVRHPIYIGMAGMFVGTGLVLTQWRAFALALGVFAVGTAVRVAAEEALLLATFGEDHRAYRKRVPAVVPRWRYR